jgi:hypothetical protein
MNALECVDLVGFTLQGKEKSFELKLVTRSSKERTSETRVHLY